MQTFLSIIICIADIFMSCSRRHTLYGCTRLTADPTRVEWYLRKQNWTHIMLCQIVTGPQFQNFTLKCCFLAWRRTSENFDCYPKMAEILFYLTFLIKGCTWSKMCFIVCLKAKNERNSKIFRFLLCPSQKRLKILISNFSFLGVFTDVKEGICKFSTT